MALSLEKTMTIKILAIDTTTEACSVALLCGDKIHHRGELAVRDHSKKILFMVDEVLKEAQLELTELTALAFGQGPGSFTGVRIGIGIAQGLAFGAQLPMIGVSTLEAMAQAAYRLHGATQVASAIDARMGEIYWGRYLRQADGQWQKVEAECVIAPQALIQQVKTVNEGQWWQVGSAWQAYPQLADELALSLCVSEVIYPNAEDMAQLALKQWELGHSVFAQDASPVYLRDTVAWKKVSEQGV